MSAEWWYVDKTGERMGPVEWSTLKELASTGKIGPAQPVWHLGMSGWVRADTVPDLLKSGRSDMVTTMRIPGQAVAKSSLNRNQRLILLAGMIGVVIIAVFPPLFVQTGSSPLRMGWGRIWAIPLGWSIDPQLFLMELSVVAMLTIGGVVMFKSKS